MVLIATTLPLDSIHSKEQIVESKEIFLIKVCVHSKKLDRDCDLQHFYYLLEWCSYFYDKVPTVYLMSDRHYYNSTIYKVMGNTYSFMSHEKAPGFMSEAREHPEIWKRLPEEKRVFNKDMIFETLNSFQYCNFRHIGCIERKIGEMHSAAANGRCCGYHYYEGNFNYFE